MKQGGVVPQPKKQRRTSPITAAHVQAPQSEPNPVNQWRTTAGDYSASGLGRASKDWELPDVNTDDLRNSFVTSWEDAEAMATAKTQHHPQPQWKPAASPASVPYGSSAASVAPIATHSTGNSGFQSFPPAPSMQTQVPPQQPPAAHFPGSSGASVVTASTISTGRGSVSTMATHSTGGSGPQSAQAQQSYASVGAPLQAFHQLPQGQSQPQQQFNSFGAPSQTQMPSNDSKQPITTAQAPKAALYQLYGRKPRRKQLSNDDYLVWNNGGRPHELKFTAIFHCPLTGELFPAARHGDPKYYVSESMMNHLGQKVEVVWYTKKSLAEHGAACRVLDCLNYREAVQTGNDPQTIVYMGDDAPYMRTQAPDLPPVPPLVGAKIEENNRRVEVLRGGMNHPS